jgi:lipopolysaccharide transport system ATP-binding protein
MSDAIIKVENVGKCYRLHHEKQERYTTLRDVMTRKAKGLFKPSIKSSQPSSSDEDFWALKDLNFEIKQGEVVGIIGRNGAGKSTLLKILSRITEPTTGRITLRGRVASLLEVGTGFHPELTGRENIFLNGAILGMRKDEIKSKFDEIVAFAEVEKFLDTPVKRYSSGMYVRLAFAVAAHLEPEILVVDEVLAVGDAEFQKKCLGKMKEVSVSGRTILLVSHNMAATQSICKRTIFLERGTVGYDGIAAEGVRKYLEASIGNTLTTVEKKLTRDLLLIGPIATPRVIEQHGDVEFSFELASMVDDVIGDLALLIHSATGDRIALIDLRSSSKAYKLSKDQSLKIRVKVAKVSLVEADYSIGLYINSNTVNASFMHLLDISVTPSNRVNGVTPREAQYRGIIELDSEVLVSMDG